MSSTRAWRSYEDSDFDPYIDYPVGLSSSSRGSGLASYIPHVPHETDRMLPLPPGSPSLQGPPSTVTSRQTFASDAPLIPVSEVGYGLPVSMRLVPNRPFNVSERDANASGSESSSSDSAHGVQSNSSTFVPEAGPSNPRRSLSTTSFPSSPLNPAPSPTTPLPPFARPHLPSTRSSIRVTRIASEDSRALSGYFPPSPLLGGMDQGPQRGSMILYRLADPLDDHSPLSPPVFPGSNRESIISTTESVMSLSSDSKYPSGMLTNTERGLVAYAYDPDMDGRAPGDDEMDRLHDPKTDLSSGLGGFGWRGVGNIGMLVVLISAILCLFIVFPAVQVFHGNDALAAIAANTRINSTGQASDISDIISGISEEPTERRSLWKKE